MQINDLPQEILSDILYQATKLNEAEGPHFTYGLCQLQLPLTTIKLHKYVRGPVSAESMRWDATASIRQVCSSWHQWALGYNLENVFERRWRGGERWANLPPNRSKAGLYELIDKPSDCYVRQDPYGSLKSTDALFKAMPAAANNVKRLWFNGFHAAETDKLILSIVANCRQLEYLSVPWTVLRRGSAEDWINLLNRGTGKGQPLHSLEFQATCLDQFLRKDLEEDKTPCPLKDPRIDFRSLKRLKFFGNTLHKPIEDADLELIARTATNLECLDFTNLSTVSVAGMLALVKASHKTLQVLEHSPRSDDGFYHPFPGNLETDEHVCDLLTSLPAMRDLSLSIPFMCASLFAKHEQVKWAGDLQVRFTDLCGCTSETNSITRAQKLSEVLRGAHTMIANKRRLRQTFNVELFFAGCIFVPGDGLVHGDFAMAQIRSSGQWPREKKSSTLGPYGQTGTYGKEEGFWDAVSEKEYLDAVEKGWIPL
jgi:hypothetical protein